MKKIKILEIDTSLASEAGRALNKIRNQKLTPQL